MLYDDSIKLHSSPYRRVKALFSKKSSAPFLAKLIGKLAGPDLKTGFKRSKLSIIVPHYFVITATL